MIVAHPWLAILSGGRSRCCCSPGRPCGWIPVFRRGNWLPEAAESVHALHTLERMDRAGVVQSLRVIVELPDDSIAQTDAGWNAIDRISKRLASDPRCDRVISITTIAEGNRSSPQRPLARDTPNISEQ